MPTGESFKFRQVFFQEWPSISQLGHGFCAPVQQIVFLAVFHVFDSDQIRKECISEKIVRLRMIYLPDILCRASGLFSGRIKKKHSQKHKLLDCFQDELKKTQHVCCVFFNSSC